MYCNDPVLDALGILDYADEQGSYYVENTVNNLVPPHRSYGYAGAHTDVVRDLVLDVDNLFDDAYNETREEWNDAEYCQIEPDSLYPTYYSAGYRAAAPLFFMPFSEASTDIPHSLPESPTDGFAPSDGASVISRHTMLYLRTRAGSGSDAASPVLKTEPRRT